MASTLIKNGLVYDGLGNAPQKADIYIKDDRIERIGETICQEADLVVDAAGRAVTPGFIDIHLSLIHILRATAESRPSRVCL